MATDPVLRMLGLARRAGKLAYGDELVREACFDHKTRCVFIAGDAGANAAKKAAFYADKANVPCVTLPHGKLELGSAIGKAGCAMCAVADIGMAAAAVNKLAEQDPAYAEVAQQLSEKNVKIQSRRGVKKHKDKAEKTEEGKPIYHISQLTHFCRTHKVLMGIITVPAEAAQQVADQLIAGGIKGIWNFAPTHLDVPPNILVQYENMATSLAVLSVHLQAQIKEEKEVRK